MSKLTPWFGGNHKPVRPGVYQRKMQIFDWLYAEWTGYQWLRAEGTIARAEKSRAVSNLQSLPWRGLAEQPKHDIEALARQAGFIIETPLRGSAWHPIGPSCKTELLKFAALLLGK